MNAPVNIVVPTAEHHAHILRSRFLDAFAEVEGSVVQMAAMAAKPPSEGASLGQRIAHARQAQPGPRLSKDNLTKACAALDDVSSLLPLRADIVHSVMRVAQVDAATTLISSNARTAHMLCPPVRMRIRYADKARAGGEGQAAERA